MRRSLLLSVIISFLFFWGCSQDSSVIEPVQDNTQYNLIELPTGSGFSAEAENTFTFNVNGWEGAYQTLYLNFPGSNATVAANYTFPKNVFTGQKTISITFNNDLASATYLPSPLSFFSPVIANITYMNLNLSTVNPANVKFVYIPATGSVQTIPCDRIEVNKTTGMIKVVNARLYHFSRYGFVDAPPAQ